MTKEELNNLSQEIWDISSYFDDTPWIANKKELKEDFNIHSINTPSHYWEIFEKIEEVSRETRILFLCSIFNKLCIEENKVYHFDTPFQAGMRYDAVMKNKGKFYLRDEDGDFGEIFTSVKFMQFINEFFGDI